MLKALHGNRQCQQAEVMELFKQELGCLIKLTGRSPNIVSIYDFGIEDEPWIVMQHVQGASLTEIIQSEQPISLARFRFIMGGILDGLAVIHGAEGQMMHLDLKPQNIVLKQPDELPVILRYRQAGGMRLPPGKAQAFRDSGLHGTGAAGRESHTK